MIDVDLYVGLTSVDALRIGNKDNNESESRPLTDMDLCWQLRQVLYSINALEDHEEPVLNSQVKKLCAQAMDMESVSICKG